MPETISREIHLKRRPAGLPSQSDFELAEVPIPVPTEGQVLVRNLYMSVDPYMRGRMRDRSSYVGSFSIGQPLEGGCVGQVIQSNGGMLPAGDYVLGFKGWREYYVSDGTDLTRIDPKLALLPSYLGIMGMPGMTAYVGLLDIGQPKEGDTVFVSAAAGAVGSVACQIAKIKGCRVVGSAGSDEKVRWLQEEAGIDAAFNYKNVQDLSAELGRLCPDGSDIDFENVGGAHLEAALGHMNSYGRVVLRGMISQYNAAGPVSGPGNLFLAITRRLKLQGYIVSDHPDRRPQFEADMSRWISEGRIHWKETILEGIDNAPKAFIGLFQGENFGKMLVRVGPDPGPY